jgi:LPS-assembly protein
LHTDCFPRAVLVLAALIATARAQAGDMCPIPPHYVPRSAAEIAADDHLIHIETDGFTAGDDGNAELTGRVSVTQDARRVTADTVNYSGDTGRITVSGAVDFEDPLVRIESDTGSYDQTGGADFKKSTFELLDRPGRGSANELTVQPGGKISLEQVRYTTCPVGDKDWMLQASSINLDTVKQEGIGHGVWMQFKGVPIFYTPYISFPLGSERKSGFLVPILNHSGSNGYEIGVSYYFDLAPNYDLTLTPEYLSLRGVELGGEFRFLTDSSHGQIETEFLPNDKETNSDRYYLHLTDVTDFKPGLRSDVDIAAVSDSNYFQDFGVGSEQTSVTFLERTADLKYYDDYWRIRGQLQNFQTIDTSVAAWDRPYSRVPRLDAEGLFPLGGTNFEFDVNSEAVNFLREVGPSGVRVDVSPEFRWVERTSSYFFVPAVGWHLTQYSLQDPNPGAPSAPFRSVPYATVDTGLIFDRDSGSDNQRTQTLEPRLVYTYVPYRNQDGLPIFDSALPDLNLSELFRANRYVGMDRISDANQLSAAVTTRLFEQSSGQQLLSATLGQIRYFEIPRVDLPCQIAYGEIPPVTLPCQTPEVFNASDMVGNISVTAYKNWSVNLDYVWDPYRDQTQKSEFSIQYRPDPSRVVNLAYRYQKDSFEQWDGSFAWPLTNHWNAVGRLVYSIMDKQTIEQVAGIEYKSCCWRIQLVQRRYVDNRPATPGAPTPSLGQSIALELQLIGLSSVGKTSNAFLERSISGYSASDQSSQP